MNIKRINEHTVRCTISEEELQEYGIEMKDLVNQSDKVQEFMEYIIDEAREQAGFQAMGDQLSAQVMAMPSKGLVIILSELKEESMWGQIRGLLSNMVEDIVGDNEEKQEESDSDMDSLSSFLRRGLDELESVEDKSEVEKEAEESDVMERFEEDSQIQENDSNNTNNGKPVKEEQAEESNISIWKFSNLSVVEQFCASVFRNSKIKSTLYKEENGNYFLLLDAQDSTSSDMAYICGNVMEFASLDSTRMERRQWLEEHAIVLIRDKAIPVLGKL